MRLMVPAMALCLTLGAGPASSADTTKTVRYAVVSARSFEVKPDTREDMGPVFRRMIEAVVAAGEPVEIQLERGVYRIGGGAAYNAALAIEKARHLIIRGKGRDTEMLLLNPRQGGFFVAESEDVWIKDLVMDHDPVPYTQGHILLTNAEEGWFDFAVQRGYPRLDEDWFADAPKPYGQWGMVFDAAEPRLKRGAADFIFMDAWAPLSRRVWRMRPVKEQWDRINDMRLGDRFVYLARHGKGGCVFFWRCRESGVRNLVVYSSQSLAVGSVSSDRITVDGMVVQPRPGTDRLLSTNSDGVHMQQNLRGPIIENCRFEGMADDGINIYYNPNTITAVISDTVIRASLDGVIEADDLLQFFDPYEGRILAEVEVKEVRPTPDNEYRITLATPVSGIRAAPEGHMIYNLSRCGADYVIRNNRFRNHRRHAMMLKAPYGLIEHNLIESVGGLGIVVGNDPEWPEGVIPHDLVLRDNSIKDVGYSRWYGQDPRGAAIQLCTKALGGRLAAERRLRNVIIENNIIINPPGAALYIGAARDIHVKGLRVFYREDGVMPREAAAVIVEDAAGVHLEGMRIESRQEASTAGLLIEASVEPGAAGVSMDAIQLSGPPGMKTAIDKRE